MTKSEKVRPWWRLAWLGWCYVAVVAAVAVTAYASPVSNTNAGAFLGLPILTFPLGVVAIAPAYVLPVLVAVLSGADPDSGSWLVGTTFTFVWMMTAWGNALAARALVGFIGTYQLRLCGSLRRNRI
ncbi:hypothetical protein [Nocardioides conyzicola]|uniref:Uncharacterized protein n=1 Tax=Nocardioides conyzicola TaxID=1651781 RepID=A0ABP8WPN8_9ACTN